MVSQPIKGTFFIWKNLFLLVIPFVPWHRDKTLRKKFPPIQPNTILQINRVQGIIPSEGWKGETVRMRREKTKGKRGYQAEGFGSWESKRKSCFCFSLTSPAANIGTTTANRSLLMLVRRQKGNSQVFRLGWPQPRVLSQNYGCSSDSIKC